MISDPLCGRSNAVRVLHIFALYSPVEIVLSLEASPIYGGVYGEYDMETGVRACAAYVAGTLISGRRCSSIYDYGQSQHIMFSGDVSAQQVRIFDHTDGAHFTGSASGSQFSLYHYGQGHHVNLKVDGNQFSGYDFGTGSHFSGTVNGNTVAFYDYGSSGWFNYSL